MIHPVLNRRLTVLLCSASFLLLLPLIAMGFTDEVQWQLPDFVVGGILIYTLAFGLELILRKIRSRSFRMAMIVVLLLLFMLVWAELAVGLFGTPWAGS